MLIIPEFSYKMFVVFKSLSHVEIFCNPMDSSVHGIFQPRMLERVAIAYSKGSSPSRDQSSTFSIDRFTTREALKCLG